MKDITIRYLADCREHIPTLAQWFHDEWGYMHTGSSVEQEAERIENCLNHDTIPMVIIVEKNGEILGSASIVEHDMDTHTHLSPWLANVYVKRQSRRKGIGTILVKRILEESTKLGIKALFLFTPDRSQFYEKFGWKTIEEPVYKHQKVYVMHFKHP